MATPTVWTEAPARTPRTNTLLDLIDVKPFPGGRAQPVEFISDNCEWPVNTPADCYIEIGDAQGTAKTIGGIADPTVGQTFGVFAGVTCFVNGGVDEFRSAARRRLENGESAVIEETILANLTSTGTGTGATMTGAVAALENALASVNAQGIIWMGPGQATVAASENLLIRDPLSGNLTTYLGTPVVVAASLQSSAVVYATGPVTVWGSDIAESDGYELTKNLATALAERVYSFAVECGSWTYTLTAPFITPIPTTGTSLGMTLGTVPASPVSPGTDVTVHVNTTAAPSEEIHLFAAINGGTWVDLGEMTEVTSDEFVFNYETDTLSVGDTVSLRAWHGATMSNQIELVID